MLINSLKCSTVKKKKKKRKKKILKIVDIIWVIIDKSQCVTLLSVSIVKDKCKIKQKRNKQKDESRLTSKEILMPFKLYLENNIFTKYSG